MWLGRQVERVLHATSFLSRLPVPHAPTAPTSRTLQAAPVAGLLIGAGPALLLILSSRAGLPSLAVAVLAVCGLVVATGGLHEDGLADVADGFGGGATVTRKLAIMRDSRIGAFGTLAVGLGLLLRVAALQGLVDRSGAAAAAAALVSATVVSRGLMLVPLALLPPARMDGLAHAAQGGEEGQCAPALAIALVLGSFLALPAATDALQVAAALLGSGAAALAMTRLARRHLRGVTGDVVGATQQVTEILLLLVLCAGTTAR